MHYTPSALADFLAARLTATLRGHDGEISVLDPACGDGQLLAAFIEQMAPGQRSKVRATGYELDPVAAGRARDRLLGLGALAVTIQVGDFLDATDTQSDSLFGEPRERVTFDAVISNPPYVRTQTLGAAKAQKLAQQFGLTGRVDLYHSFAIAMTLALRPGGALGLLTSNRFLMIQSGAAMRRLLRSEYAIHEVFDLGDTKMFGAAVLPAIVVATRGTARSERRATFSRVYELRGKAATLSEPANPLDYLREGRSGVVQHNGSRYEVKVAALAAPSDPAKPWTAECDVSRSWLGAVEAQQATTFGDVANIRVGIKTTADSVFIRDDWHLLPEEQQPEPDLLRPLVTHGVKARWLMSDNGAVQQRVLYPHEQRDGERKRAVDISKFPRASAYLAAHRERLESRKYVIDAGRKWYEVWVPQSPSEWRLPRLVFPDIAEHPRFFLDRSGAIVNGDCYWITLREGVPEETLLLMLGIANSTFITRYYDLRFHNKLYAGRRRFMTQYVREFPLPEVRSPEARAIIEAVGAACAADADDVAEHEARVSELVWTCFGLTESGVVEEVARQV